MSRVIGLYHGLPHDESPVRFWKAHQRHPYADFDYFANEYAHRRDDWKPLIFVIRDKGAIRSCVIGRTQRLPVSLQLGYRIIGGPRLNTLIIHRTGFLGEWHGSDYELLQEKLEQLMSSGILEVLSLRAIPRDSPLHELACSKLPFLRRDHFQIAQEHWLLNRVRSFEGFLKSHTHIKGTYRKHGNRLRKLYGNKLQIECYAEPHELDVMLEQSEEIARKTWQRKLGNQSFLSDDVRARYLFCCNHGWSRDFVLSIDKLPVAYLHGIAYRNVFYAEHKGYDPAYRSQGVGTYLLIHVIREMCEDESIHCVDFNVGNDEDKRRYCDSSFQVADIQLFGPAIKLQTLNLLRILVQGSHQLGKGLAHRTGFYQSLRKRLR